MWMVVYVAPNRKVAKYLQEMLEFEGILVKMKARGDQEKEEHNIELMVSEVEVEEANEVITNALQRP